MESGTKRSLGVRTPLKITAGGTTRFYRASSASAEFKGTAGWKLEPHWCVIHVEDPSQGVPAPLTCSYDKLMELHCLLL